MVEPLKPKIISALRRLWLYYGDNRKQAIINSKVEGGYICCQCGVVMRTQKELKADHITNLTQGMGDRIDWNLYMNRLFNGEIQILCRNCHDIKTHQERRVKALEAKRVDYLLLYFQLNEGDQESVREAFKGVGLTFNTRLASGEKVDPKSELYKKYLNKKGVLKKKP